MTRKRKVTVAQLAILCLLRDAGYRPVMLYEEAGYNKFPAIKALQQRGHIEVVHEGGYFSLFAITDSGHTVLEEVEG